VIEARAVVDSSGWIEVFTNGPLAERFIAALEAEAALVVPAISILEVFKWVLREHSEAQAIQAVAVMQRGSAMHCGFRWPTASSSPLHVPIRPGSTRWLPISRISTTWN
jgi:hypothetical protein